MSRDQGPATDMIQHCIGTDVQVSRGLACAILRMDGSSCAALWCQTPQELIEQTECILKGEGGSLEASAFAVDSPRQPLLLPREHYWDRAGRRWRSRKTSEAGRGCSVGDGDGLGTIVLPRPLDQPIQEVLDWPAS